MIVEIDNFKKNVCIVEIENSSFCNRKCSYCINHYIDRYSQNEKMPIELFEKIIDELAEINYDRMVTFHRYNEPFYDKNPMIIERIAYARKKLPNANLVASSNSDYLDSEYVQEIRMAGLDSLYCQCQTEGYGSVSIDDIRERILAINKKIGNFRGKFIVNEESCVFTTIGSGFTSLTIQARDFTNSGFNRGGIVKNIISKECEGVCYQPLISFTIDYNGKVTGCSNTVSYYDGHDEFVIGDANMNTIFEIYKTPKAIALRRKLLEEERQGICKGCKCSYEKYARKYGIV